MAKGLSGENFVRMVGGDVHSALVTSAANLRIEKIKRVANGPWHWHFRQPELCLFWFEESRPQTLRAKIDGRPATYLFTGGSQFCIIPPGAEIEGEWIAGSNTKYTVAFLQPDLVEEQQRRLISRPVFAFEHPALLRGLSELSYEAERPDGVFNLLAEGWALQAVAHMIRVSQDSPPRNKRTNGGLSGRNARIVKEFIDANLGEDVALQNLAELIGISSRHFQRAFQATFGIAPYRFIIQQRIQRAKRELSDTKQSVAEVALTNGFHQPEHFASVFKRFTGVTPSQYRQRNS